MWLYMNLVVVTSIKMYGFIWNGCFVCVIYLLWEYCDHLYYIFGFVTILVHSFTQCRLKWTFIVSLHRLLFLLHHCRCIEDVNVYQYIHWMTMWYVVWIFVFVRATVWKYLIHYLICNNETSTCAFKTFLGFHCGWCVTQLKGQHGQDLLTMWY